ncbi:MAG: hypothetical protein ACKKMW_01900 [Candidatus Nealsonbacteria bacterium]
MSMEFKQSTIGDLIESERKMVLTGAERYGEYFINASEFNALLNNFVKSIDDPNKFIFVAFLSQVRKHHTLALFSSVRLHHIQTGLNLRQVLEAGAWAAYAMAHKNKDKFCEADTNNILNIPKRLQTARNNWLNQNFKIKSDEIKRLKELINKSVAHANIVYALQNFEMMPAGDPGFYTPFFDFNDEYKVKNDLWFIANTALGLIDLFYGVNQQYKVFQLVDDFNARFKQLVDHNNKLKLEMMEHPRFKKHVKR